MSASQATTDPTAPVSKEEMMTALFAYLVSQQAQMALMLLGKTPNPETGQTMCDLEAAKMFIDQLEMLEVKTKGNLNKQESALLKQSLMSLHMAYVDAVEAPAETKGPAAAPAQPAKSGEPEKPAGAGGTDTGAAASEDEHRKKFTKKY